MGRTGELWLLLAAVVAAQTIMPSNNSADLTDPTTSPRFYMNASGSVQFPGFVIAPLGEYAYISRNAFLGIDFPGRIVNTDASNANQVQSHDFNFVPCDPEEYAGGNLDVNAVLRIITNQQPDSFGQKSSLIFYSTRSNHCNASNIMTLPDINGIFTTVDPVVAAQIANRNFTETSNAIATLSPDTLAYTANGPSSQNSGSVNPPTTAVAMIILYSITGIITGLFVIIIITGAVRAHRHPERYGPRNSPGRARQTRAMGIARAVLETLPIVKFGDHQDVPKPKEQSQGDVEMTGESSAESSKSSQTGDKPVVTTTTAAVSSPLTPTTPQPHESTDKVTNADGSDEVGSLGCSICTEDFQKGEEVRVLPCNHKFHPDCVDPWLLNVSGTCPLCRINLTQPERGANEPESNIAPPLASASPFGDRRSQAIHNLMAIAYGSREERISALRQYRTERRDRNTSQVNEEERISRTRRFREALRIRTRRHEPTEPEREMRNSGVDAISGGQMRI